MSELDEVKKLPPDERLKRLKELEEERKREIEEAESLIRDSMREISEVQERKHVPIKQVAANDISQLLTAEEKSVFRTARFATERADAGNHAAAAGKERNLEEVAEEEHPGKKPEQEKMRIYGQKLEEARKGIDYSARTTTGVEREKSKGVDYAAETTTGRDAKEGRESYVRGAEQQRVYARSPAQEDAESRTSGMYGREKEQRRKFMP